MYVCMYVSQARDKPKKTQGIEAWLQCQSYPKRGHTGFGEWRQGPRSSKHVCALSSLSLIVDDGMAKMMLFLVRCVRVLLDLVSVFYRRPLFITCPAIALLTRGVHNPHHTPSKKKLNFPRKEIFPAKRRLVLPRHHAARVP